MPIKREQIQHVVQDLIYDMLGKNWSRAKAHYHANLKKLGSENRTESYYSCPILVTFSDAEKLFFLRQIVEV